MATIVENRETYLAPKQVAQRLGVHVSAVYRSIARGELAFVRLGRRSAIRIPVSELEPRERRDAA